MSATPKDPATPISVAETADDATTVSRRGFLRGIGSAGVLAAAAGTPLITPSTADAEVLGPADDATRAGQAARVRQRAARNALANRPPQATNSDEMLYDDFRGSFFKTLPQNDLGEVDDAAYKALLTALDSGSSDDFAAVPLSVQADRKLANPMAAFAFEMTGGDGHSSRIPAAPAFASATTAAEMA
ncbi:MAG: twin-arginine translocation signal domain-containing protein, partial [Acidobacteriota bacterium]